MLVSPGERLEHWAARIGWPGETVTRWEAGEGRIRWSYSLRLFSFSLSFKQVHWCVYFVSVLIIMYYSAEDHHGCLVKENSQVFGGSNSELLKSIPSTNIEACSKACAENSDCDTFNVDNGKTCRLYKKGTIYSSSFSTAGFCPKGIVSMAAQTYIHINFWL